MENDEKFVDLDEVKKNIEIQSNDSEKDVPRKLLVVFKLNNEEYGLPIEKVKEVVRTPGVARVPQAQNYIKGVTNIRGTIVAVIDLLVRFGTVDSIQFNPNVISEYTLVIEDKKHKVGILVEDVPVTISVKENDIDYSNELLQLSNSEQNFISGIAKVEDRMIVLLELDRILNSDDATKLSNL